MRRFWCRSVARMECGAYSKLTFVKRIPDLEESRGLSGFVYEKGGKSYNCWPAMTRGCLFSWGDRDGCLLPNGEGATVVFENGLWGGIGGPIFEWPLTGSKEVLEKVPETGPAPNVGWCEYLRGSTSINVSTDSWGNLVGHHDGSGVKWLIR